MLDLEDLQVGALVLFIEGAFTLKRDDAFDERNELKYFGSRQ
jgi:hypothetical protein